MWRRLKEVPCLVIPVVGLVLLLRGCPGPDRPLDPAVVAQVRTGMSESEVLDLLGPPSEALDLESLGEALRCELTGYRWRGGESKLEVYFSDGRVSGTVARGY